MTKKLNLETIKTLSIKAGKEILKIYILWNYKRKYLVNWINVLFVNIFIFDKVF